MKIDELVQVVLAVSTELQSSSFDKDYIKTLIENWHVLDKTSLDEKLEIALIGALMPYVEVDEASNVINGIFGGADTNRVLEAAKGDYEDLVLIGFNKSGSFDPRVSSNVSPIMASYLCSEFLTRIHTGVYSG
jgi:hypothetical protein